MSSALCDLPSISVCGGVAICYTQTNRTVDIFTHRGGDTYRYRWQSGKYGCRASCQSVGDCCNGLSRETGAARSDGLSLEPTLSTLAIWLRLAADAGGGAGSHKRSIWRFSGCADGL